MPYPLSISLALGSSQANKTLKAQLVNTDGTNNGGEVSSVFVEIGNGYYMWTHNFPANFRGGIKIYETLPTIITFFTINPQETENADVKTSTVASANTVKKVDIEVGHSNAKGLTINEQLENNQTITRVTKGVISNEPSVQIDPKEKTSQSGNIVISPGVK